MKSYIRAAGLLFNQPLLMTPDMLDIGVHWANQVMGLNIINLPSAPADRMWRDDDGPDPRIAAEETRRASIASTGVSVIPVHGPLVARGAHLNACETMTSYEGLRNDLRAAVADPMVDHIVLDIDSNGGSATGAFELASDLRAMTLQKPITGIVNFSAYSGGYLIAAACSDVVVSRTSGVGSIGVISSHMDRSKQAEKMGIKVTTVYAGAHKNDLTPNEPLSDQSLQVLTDLVQESYQQFVEAVAEYRGMTVDQVRATEAALYRGQAALDSGLADRLQSPQDAIDSITRSVAEARAQRQSGRVSVRAAAMQIQSQI
jgi:capsid assembly protease